MKLGNGCGAMAAALLAAIPAIGRGQSGLEEIVVTAQKRSESAQDVPIAIDVVPGDQFIAEGVRDVKDFYKMSTELEINSGAGQAQMIGMRGMQQQGFAQTGETLTAVHLDGAYLGSFWGLNGLMFDVQRVEVLAGPQGTLYGRNATAGAINIITTRPGAEFEGVFTTDLGSYDTVRNLAAVTLPATDNFSLRLAGQRYERDALFNDGSAAQDQWGGRVTGLWLPSDDDELLFTIDRTVFNGTNDPTTLYDIDESARLPDGTTPTSITSLVGSPTLSDPYDILPYYAYRGLEFDGRNWQDHKGAMIQYTHDFDGFSAVAQYSNRKFQNVSRAAAKPLALYTGALTYAIDQATESADVRLVSDSGGSIEWVAGAFYYKSTSNGWAMLPGANESPNGPIDILTGQPSRIDPFTGLTIGCPCLFGFWPNSGDAESYAFYGQTTWTPENNDRLHLTLGLRFTHDWKDARLGYWSGFLPIFAFGLSDFPAEARQLFADFGLTTDSAPTASSTGTNERSWDATQYKIGIEYDVGDNVLLYGSLGTGYKAGAFTYGITPELAPEDLTALEFGVKSTLRDGTLRLNASVWWYDYQDLEANIARPLNPPILNPFTGLLEVQVGSTASVGEANLGGVAMDMDWLVTEKDQLGVSFTYVHSEVKDGTEDGSTVPIFHTGARIGNAPEWNVLMRYARTFMLENGGQFVAGAKYQWQTEKYDEGVYLTQPFYPNNRQFPQTTIPSRGILDLTFSYMPMGERWDITAYVRNATDELLIHSLAYDGAYQQPSPGVYVAGATFGHVTGVLGEPRTYGIVFNTRF